MVGLIAKRLAAMIGVLLVLAAIVFALQRSHPTDPVHVYLGANAARPRSPPRATSSATTSRSPSSTCTT